MFLDNATGLLPAPLSRRRLLKTAVSCGCVLSCFKTKKTIAAETLDPLNRYPRMVHEYFVEQLRRAQRRHSIRV